MRQREPSPKLFHYMLNLQRAPMADEKPHRRRMLSSRAVRISPPGRFIMPASGAIAHIGMNLEV
jgi:hypothetical protein